ncbi:MAG: hypothetical protein QXQ64_06365 [Candidatus Bathyarchaeia archaeon]
MYLKYYVEATKPVRVQYRVNNGSWEYANNDYETLLYLRIPVQPETESNIEIRAVDQEGNYSNIYSDSNIHAYRRDYGGLIVTTDSKGTDGALAAIQGREKKGSIKLTLDPPGVPFGEAIQAGGGSASYWLWAFSSKNGVKISGQKQASFSDSRFTFLEPQNVFISSGSALATLDDNEQNILSLKSLVEPNSGLSVYRLMLSGSHRGYFHRYDTDQKIVDRTTDTSEFLTGIRDENFAFPMNIGDSVNSDKTNLVGLFSKGEGVWWGSFLGSPGTFSGYSAGYLKDSTSFDFMIYGVYGNADGAGLIKGEKSGSNNFYLDLVKAMDAEPKFTFTKYAQGSSTIEVRESGIKGGFQGFFDTGSFERTNIENTSSGAIGSKTLSIVRNGEPEPWGVFGIELGGTYSGSPLTFTLEFGGETWDNNDSNDSTRDYWYGSIKDGEISGSIMRGVFSGKFMSPTHYGTISGRTMGELKSDNTWVGVVIGTYGEDVLRLGHNSEVTGAEVYKGSFEGIGASISAYLGGTHLNANEPLYSVGMIDDPNKELDLSQGAGYVWMSTLTSEMTEYPKYKFYASGRIASNSDNYYNLNGHVAGIIGNEVYGYSGLFVGDLLTDNSPNLLSLEKRFFMEGTIRGVVDLDSTSSVSEGQIRDINVLSSGSSNDPDFSVTLLNVTGNAFIDTEKYGIGIIGMGGTYQGNPSDWYMVYEGALSSGDFGAIAYGSIWGNDGNIQSVIKGKTFGYYSDLSKEIPVTGIFVGETVGTFNPSATQYRTWQTVTVGTTLETSTFLGKVASSRSELGSIGVPAVEIGRVNLSGTNSDSSCNNCIKDVRLTDVRFFASSTGSPPTVFATDRVTGSYSGNPLSSGRPSDRQITIGTGSTGNNMISNLIFEVSSWSNDNSNKWSAKIYPGNGAIGSIGTDPSYTIHDMRGIAAGTYDGGQFSGTAAGIVRAK